MEPYRRIVETGTTVTMPPVLAFVACGASMKSIRKMRKTKNRKEHANPKRTNCNRRSYLNYLTEICVHQLHDLAYQGTLGHGQWVHGTGAISPDTRRQILRTTAEA